MLSRVSMVAVDLDGTLLNSSGRVSERTREIMGRAHRSGVLVVAATGRPRPMARWITDDLEFISYVVCHNGAQTYLPDDGRVIHTRSLDPELARTAGLAAREFAPEVSLGVEHSDDSHHLEAGVAALLPLRSETPTVVDAMEHVAGDVLKVLAHSAGHDLHEFVAALGEIMPEGVESAHAGLPFAELGPVGVSKASALDRLARDHGFDASEVVAFGDGHNDTEMLRWAGWSVAMANGDPEIREGAHEVTLTNDEDGVAAVVERFLA